MKRGRPREIDNPVRLNLSVEAEHYDQLYAAAKRSGESIQTIIRRGVYLVLRNCTQTTTSAQ